MIVIRIQIQITKKKISTTIRSSSPKLISARGSKGVLSEVDRWADTSPL
jgi:hypothetical protein